MTSYTAKGLMVYVSVEITVRCLLDLQSASLDSQILKGAGLKGKGNVDESKCRRNNVSLRRLDRLFISK